MWSVSLLALAALGDAADKPKKLQFTGTVESVDTATGTCTVTKVGKDKQAVTKTFRCTDACTYVTHGRGTATLDAFVAGDKVTVSYIEAGDQLLCHKLSLNIQKPKKEKPKTD